MKRRKLTPLLRMATISVWEASLAVTNTVALNTVIGLSMLA